MNHMEEIAHILGVELGEKFKINFHGDMSSDEYYIDETTIHEVCDGRVNDYCYPLLIALLNGTDTVVKLPKSILTEQERNYLSQVIKPFREKIQHISKLTGKNGEYICIDIRFDWEEDSILLPRFATGTLYKGMEIGKEYSVKDLGL